LIDTAQEIDQAKQNEQLNSSNGEVVNLIEVETFLLIKPAES
jgi:hypothetical protein